MLIARLLLAYGLNAWFRFARPCTHTCMLIRGESCAAKRARRVSFFLRFPRPPKRIALSECNFIFREKKQRKSPGPKPGKAFSGPPRESFRPHQTSIWRGFVLKNVCNDSGSALGLTNPRGVWGMDDSGSALRLANPSGIWRRRPWPCRPFVENCSRGRAFRFSLFCVSFVLRFSRRQKRITLSECNSIFDRKCSENRRRKSLEKPYLQKLKGVSRDRRGRAPRV